MLLYTINYFDIATEEMRINDLPKHSKYKHT